MILLLGGTAEARALAVALVEARIEVTSSLAGRVADPALPAGAVRIGGFGGIDGLVRYLRDQRITAVVDATHPFAAAISAHAAVAAELSGVPLLRLTRPGWRHHRDADRWLWVADTDAARRAADTAERPFLTTGRQSLDRFLPWSDRAVVVRVVDPPAFAVPPAWTVIRSRGPYRLAAERQLMLDHRVDTLITKDSGGQHTEAKLQAARELGLPVVVIERPDPAAVPQVADVTEALVWVRARVSAVEPGRRSSG